jgi:hypothetical protein
MNCHYHPEVPATAYCQFCGKPLCRDCVRNVAGAVYCESCLAERLNAAAGVTPGLGLSTGTPHPLLAAVLGFIPGVGAMYNGQYPKAIAHVLIFSVLVSMSHAADVLGVLVAAWVFYQVFDAYQTAIARRDGLPLPNPFGLNDIAQRLGILPMHGPGVPPGPLGNPAAPPPPSSWQAGPASGFVPGTSVPPGQPTGAQPGYGEPYAGAPQQGYAATPGYPPPGYPPPGYAPPAGYSPAGYAPVPPVAPFEAPFLGRRDLPVGAILLIGFGVLFLFGSLGLLHERWLAHGWPVLIIALGVWIMVRRARYTTPVAGAGPAGNGPAGGGQ